MSFIKAIVPAILLTWVVCIVLGNNHSKGGALQIHMQTIYHYSFYWSWSLFAALFALAWSIFWLME